MNTIYWLLSKPIPSPGASPLPGGDVVENFKSIAPILGIVCVIVIVIAAASSRKGPSK